MKLKRREALELVAALDAVSNLSGIKFAYAMAKNVKLIASEVEDMQAGLKPSKRYQEYDNKRVEICKEHSKKDDNGKPVMMPLGRGQQGFAGLEDNPEFEVAVEALREEYKSELDEREQLVAEYETALDEDIELDVYTVNLSDVPEDITTGQLKGIIDLVVDSEKEK